LSFASAFAFACIVLRLAFRSDRFSLLNWSSTRYGLLEVDVGAEDSPAGPVQMIGDAQAPAELISFNGGRELAKFRSKYLRFCRRKVSSNGIELCPASAQLLLLAHGSWVWLLLGAVSSQVYAGAYALHAISLLVWVGGKKSCDFFAVFSNGTRICASRAVIVTKLPAGDDTMWTCAVDFAVAVCDDYVWYVEDQ
jgi:hypothetical protein